MPGALNGAGSAVNVVSGPVWRRPRRERQSCSTDEPGSKNRPQTSFIAFRGPEARLNSWGNRPEHPQPSSSAQAHSSLLDTNASSGRFLTGTPAEWRAARRSTDSSSRPGARPGRVGSNSSWLCRPNVGQCDGPLRTSDAPCERRTHAAPGGQSGCGYAELSCQARWREKPFGASPETTHARAA
jgi:hypothetical protein